MATYDALIDDIVCGDDYDLVRTITNVPEDSSLATAWLTVKRHDRDPDASAVIAKEITTIEAIGQGHITDSGEDDTSAAVAFILTAAETAKLEPRRLYPFDLQVRTASGKFYTPLKGWIRAHAGITKAVS